MTFFLRAVLDKNPFLDDAIFSLLIQSEAKGSGHATTSHNTKKPQGNYFFVSERGKCSSSSPPSYIILKPYSSFFNIFSSAGFKNLAILVPKPPTTGWYVNTTRISVPSPFTSS